MKTLVSLIWVFLRGLAMGAADVVPGVSGGTIAFITGIYDRLIAALANITPSLITMIRREGLSTAWRHIDGAFLVALLCGIVTSIATLASVINTAMETYPLQVWGFFFGLVFASIVVLSRQVDLKQKSVFVALVIGGLFAWWVSVARPVTAPETDWVIFLAGSIAICAMILPGISGSFILLLIGVYPRIIAAITHSDWVTLGIFAAGLVCGILTFVHVVKWCFERFRDNTFALLIGFLIGSLNVIWPWKITLETMINSHGKVVPLVQERVLPSAFASANQGDPMVLPVLLWMVMGFILVIAIEYAGNKKGRS